MMAGSFGCWQPVSPSVAFCLSVLQFFAETTESDADQIGPMSGYLNQLKTERRRKLTILAVAIGAANLILMLSTRRMP